MTLTKESWSLVIPLVEVFYSVQGEGVNVGQPAVFVRFAGCNLDCVFADGSICDTPWRKPAFKMTISHLLGRVEALISDKLKVMKGLPWVILTGGEPTAHPSFDALVIGLVQTANRTTSGVLVQNLFFWGYADYKEHD